MTLDVDYIVTQGFTYVIIKGDYVKKLAVGTHSIKISRAGYDDITSNFTITNTSSPGSNKSKKYSALITGID